MSKLEIWVDYDRKVVCNELRRQNLISVNVWLTDARFCASRFSTATYQGYRLWAMPCVRAMRRHAWLARGLAAAVKWMSADIEFRTGLRSRIHWRGWVVHRCIFWPANRLLGLGLHCVRLRRDGHRLRHPSDVQRAGPPVI